MKPFHLLLALVLATWSLALTPPAGALEDPPECVRQGPPCGPEPVCVVGREHDCVFVVVDCLQEPCHPQLTCLVGDRDCLVGVIVVVCVTEPCDPPTVCAGWGRYCVPLGP